MRTIQVEVTEKMKNFKWSPSSLTTFCGDAHFSGGCGVRLYLDRFCGKTVDVYRKHFCFGTTTHETLEDYHSGDTKPPLGRLLDEFAVNRWIASDYKKKFRKKFGEKFLAKMEADEPLSIADIDLEGSDLTTEELRLGFPQIGDISKFLLRGEARRWMFLGYDSAVDEKNYQDTLQRILREYYERDYVKPILIEEPMEVYLGDVYVRGRIDRVDAMITQPGYMVIDYKTSKKVKTVKEMSKDFQMICYHLATRERYSIGNYQIKVALFFLKPETKIRGVFVPQPMKLQVAEITDDMIAHAVETATQADAMVKSGEFHYIDNAGKWQCPYCDHFGECGKDTGGL